MKESNDDRDSYSWLYIRVNSRRCSYATCLSHGAKKLSSVEDPMKLNVVSLYFHQALLLCDLSVAWSQETFIS
ncbi:hypothetical protein U1Q18_028570 [Sarracenia purpurea var. burkii]